MNIKGNLMKLKGLIKQYIGHQDYIWNIWFKRFKILLIRWLMYCHIVYYQIKNAFFLELI